jgi:hypothetical protein
MSQRWRLSVFIGLCIVAVAIAYLSIRRVTASPYASIRPEKAREARARIRETERLGPPGLRR